MLSPKMQRSVRVNDMQLLNLADRAQYDHSMVIRITFHQNAYPCIYKFSTIFYIGSSMLIRKNENRIKRKNNISSAKC